MPTRRVLTWRLLFTNVESFIKVKTGWRLPTLGGAPWPPDDLTLSVFFPPLIGLLWCWFFPGCAVTGALSSSPPYASRHPFGDTSCRRVTGGFRRKTAGFRSPCHRSQLEEFLRRRWRSSKIEWRNPFRASLYFKGAQSRGLWKVVHRQQQVFMYAWFIIC